ncbi:hypothetical protein IPH25_04160 [bacterium]|nr:MAG: hypothetical protein IPG37_01155 [bacterium]QQR61641.1 MAG: hypothetical protein IPH25_04160 [bacterium]QQR62794.1 MAG: hypothetical protein IPH67_05300 [bacterium]
MKTIKLLSIATCLYLNQALCTVDWFNTITSVTDNNISIIGDCMINNSTVKVEAQNTDITVTVAADSIIQGTADAVLELSVTAPYTITVKVDHKLDLFGQLNTIDQPLKVIISGTGTVVWEFGQAGILNFGRSHQSGSGELWIVCHNDALQYAQNIFKPLHNQQIYFNGKSKYGYLVYDQHNLQTHTLFTSWNSSGKTTNVSLSNLAQVKLLLEQDII